MGKDVKLRCCWDIKMEMLRKKLEISLAFRCQAKDLDWRVSSVAAELGENLKERKTTKEGKDKEVKLDTSTKIMKISCHKIMGKVVRKI